MAGDWLKLHRSILDSEQFQDPWICKLWIWCLCRANHCSNSFAGTEIPRGSFVTGRIAAADELKVSPSRVYRGLDSLQRMGCITVKSNNRFTIVTVCKYETYQDAFRAERTTDEQPTNNQRTTNGQPADTIKNSRTKEVKNPPPPFLEARANGHTLKIRAAAVFVRWTQDQRRQVIDDLDAIKLDRAIAVANEAETRGLSPEDVGEIIYEYNANRSKFRSPGAVADRVRNGCWPAEGVKNGSQIQAVDEARRKDSEKNDRDRELYLIVNAGRKAKKTDEEIKVDLRAALPLDFCESEGW